MNDSQYRQTKSPIKSSLTVVQDSEYRWGVIDSEGSVIVPFGKYAWIDGFQNGLAKVIGHNDNTSPSIIMIYDLEAGKEIKERRAEQGIINEQGEEVLPLEYNIWKFYGKAFPTIKAFKNGVEHKFSFEQLNPDLAEDEDEVGKYYNSDDDDIDYGQIERDNWDAMTDGQYGDMPDGFDGDYSFLGY